MSASLVNLVRHTVNFQKILTCAGAYGGTVVQQPVRFASNKHYDQRGRKARRKNTTIPLIHKILDHKAPDMDTPDKVRMHMKQHGILPRREFNDPIDITCTNEIFDQYLPPEGDGKSSLLSLQKGKDLFQGGLSKGKNLKDRRKLKEYDTAYDEKSFAEMAQSQLIKTYTLLQDVKSNEDELHQLVTNLAYPKLVFGLEFKTFRWKFVESIEPPRVVHLRTSKMLSQDNLYAQVTVRCHTKQILAIYDRFGRLMYGSEVVPRDVLEYVVFEKHIVNMYGEWRLHSKITPKWLPPQAPQINTQIKPMVHDREELEKKLQQLGSGDKIEAEETDKDEAIETR
ncbi:39S ribosomal protein L45, mitochondrial-like [Mizuhopecten yessoensis]|uniref:Large ribosomal subunit protein mL45 n=1 Tax=Mizuhopecten yessoensis TaxID=6573 RepID=A0A210PHA3_MIZYE|nr:39S ribosomal protein L45, mitochondrial-like [Mizuhopecten yessoensis]OWF35874.1 39S ribosomal protein L45, mitochondrial [Mizuhopecten yessoensis]